MLWNRSRSEWKWLGPQPGLQFGKAAGKHGVGLALICCVACDPSAFHLLSLERERGTQGKSFQNGWSWKEPVAWSSKIVISIEQWGIAAEESRSRERELGKESPTSSLERIHTACLTCRWVCRRHWVTVFRPGILSRGSDSSTVRLLSLDFLHIA